MNRDGVASPCHRRRRWFVVGVGLATTVVVASVILSLVFSQAGSDSSLGQIDTSVAGTHAPAFVLPALTGGTIRLEQFRSSVVVVNFWASWCVPCRGEVGSLESLDKKWRQQGVRLVGIVENDTATAARRFQHRYDVTRPSAIDADRAVAGDFGVRGVPETYVIDREGRLRAKVLGRVRTGQLDDLIRNILRPHNAKRSSAQSGQ